MTNEKIFLFYEKRQSSSDSEQTAFKRNDIKWSESHVKVQMLRTIHLSNMWIKKNCAFNMMAFAYFPFVKDKALRSKCNTKAGSTF